MHAIILAGGFGTRLRSVIADVCKPLAPIAGKPFLAWLIKALIAKGVTSVTLSVHYQWEMIRDYFDRYPVPIPLTWATEASPLGTGGAIVHALRQHNDTSPVLVLNGDTYADIDYQPMFDTHAIQNALLTMALLHMPDTERYGTIKVEKGYVVSFGPGAKGREGYINAGVYIVSPQLFAGGAFPETFSFEKDFLPSQLAILRPRAVITDSYFIDIGVPEDYARACRELPERIALL